MIEQYFGSHQAYELWQELFASPDGTLFGVTVGVLYFIIYKHESRVQNVKAVGVTPDENIYRISFDNKHSISVSCRHSPSAFVYMIEEIAENFDLINQIVSDPAIALLHTRDSSWFVKSVANVYSK